MKPWGYQVSDTVQLATLTRDGFIESRHHGLAVIVDPEGKVLEAHGAYRKQILPRSAVKPLQAVAMQRSGLKLTGAELAISAGSHQGTKEHQDLVLSILKSAGLSEANLKCPVAWPGNLEARALAIEQTRLAFNCSGKHAGFLTTCAINNWDLENYLEPDHPLQKLVVDVIEEFSGEKVTFSTIDGCGAPLHALSMAALARSIGKFTREEESIRDAMLSNAWAVGDRLAQDSLILEKGFVAKIGAEGVFVIGTKEGHGVAVKIADGSLRPAALVALKILLNQGLIEKSVFEELSEKFVVKSLGGEKDLGRLDTCF